MKNILVIGCPGSGKSTFAKALHAITDIPLFHLDRLFWNADKTTVSRSVFHKRLSEILQQDEWIVDGHYASTLEERLQVCDTVFFLDYTTEVCLSGIEERRGTARSDLPWVEEEYDDEFIEYIKQFRSQHRSTVMALLNAYSTKTIYIFRNRDEADAFLIQMQKGTM